MPINFPSSASLNATYTYEGKTWKYNSQGAWEISSSTETGNEQGNTGELAYYDATGSIIQGATAFFYDATNLRVGVGTTIPDHTLDVTGPSGTLNVKGGATFGGDVVFQGDLLLPEDGEVGIGGDTEKIVFNGSGSGSSSIDIKCTNVDFGLGSGASLRSHGDADTQIKFVNDKHGGANDGLELQQSGNLMIDVTPTRVNVAGVTFGAGGATFENNVKIKNLGDVALTLEADTDNSGENDNPLIKLLQDGGQVGFDVGINGDSNNAFDGALGNAFYISSDNANNGPIQFATSDNDRLTISNVEGYVGIGTNNPAHLLHLEGGGISADGATFDQLSVNGNLILSDDAFIGVADDEERIIFDSNGNDITMRTENVFIQRKLLHYGDGNTYIEFPSATGKIDMYADDNHFLAADSGLLHIPTGISASQGATFADSVTIHSEGDVALYLKADTDNATETDNPLIEMSQDGTAVKFQMGLLGANGDVATGSQANWAYMNTTFVNSGIHLVVNDQLLMNLHQDCNVGIGTVTPGSTMDIVGGLNVSQGATFGSTVSMKDYSETVNAIGSVNSNTAVSFQDGTVQTVTVAGNCEFSFSNPPASGKAGTVTLIVTNGGAHTTTFASAVKWPSDVAPSLTTSGVDVISFLTTDGGSNIYGFVGGLNFS